MVARLFELTKAHQAGTGASCIPQCESDVDIGLLLRLQTSATYW